MLTHFVRILAVCNDDNHARRHVTKSMVRVHSIKQARKLCDQINYSGNAVDRDLMATHVIRVILGSGVDPVYIPADDISQVTLDLCDIEQDYKEQVRHLDTGKYKVARDMPLHIDSSIDDE